MAIDATAVRRMSASDYDALVKEGAVEALDLIKGYGISLQKDDVISFGEVSITTMKSALVAADGKTWQNPYWVSRVQVTRGELHLEGDVADATFCRQGKHFPSLDAEIQKGGKSIANEGGVNFFFYAMEKCGLTAKQKQFNLQLCSSQASRARLENLSGKDLKVIATFGGYTRKFNSKKEENWGSQASHWSPVELLFFEEVKPEKKKK